MKPSLFAAVLWLLLLSPSFGQERGLEFLSRIPELRDLSLKMSEAQLQSQIEQHQLYAKKNLEPERVTYWLLTPEGENVFVGFVSGKCTGIQRMQPIPRQQIQAELGESEYRAWLAKRGAGPGGATNGAQPSSSDTKQRSATAGSTTIEIPGFSIRVLSDPGGEEWWMPSTKPLALTRYALTNETVPRPIVLTILHYASPQQASQAFAASSGGRPRGPDEIKAVHWEAAHRWTTDLFRTTDLFLLKGSYAVGVYNLPPDFSTEKTDQLLDALANYVAQAEPGGAANPSRPIRSQTNSTPSPAGSRR